MIWDLLIKNIVFHDTLYFDKNYWGNYFIFSFVLCAFVLWKPVEWFIWYSLGRVYIFDQWFKKSFSSSKVMNKQSFVSPLKSIEWFTPACRTDTYIVKTLNFRQFSCVLSDEVSSWHNTSKFPNTPFLCERPLLKLLVSTSLQN